MPNPKRSLRPPRARASTIPSRIILGIDPGLSSTGFGIIRQEGEALSLVEFGCISTKNTMAFPERLKEISERISSIVDAHAPSSVAIESLYFCKNISSALKVGQAKGAVIATCSRRKIAVYEYTPLQVKQALTGYGKASKEQIQHMVRVILGLSLPPQPSHSADALALAICCAHSLSKNV